MPEIAQGDLRPQGLECYLRLRRYPRHADQPSWDTGRDPVDDRAEAAGLRTGRWVDGHNECARGLGDARSVAVQGFRPSDRRVLVSGRAVAVLSVPLDRGDGSSPFTKWGRGSPPVKAMGYSDDWSLLWPAVSRSLRLVITRRCHAIRAGGGPLRGLVAVVVACGGRFLLSVPIILSRCWGRARR